MKTVLNKIIPITILFVSILLIGISCNGNDNDEPELPECNQRGLHYKIDGGQEVFLPSDNLSGNINYYEHQNTGVGNLLMVHQLGNGYLFQSSATDIGQTSTHNIDVTTVESSKLDVFGLWSNTDNVNITYRCDELQDQVNGDVYYSFTGTFQSGSDPVKQIEGYLCVKIHEIR